jgi:predicted transposase/invertase (TIGR01784 family)
MLNDLAFQWIFNQPGREKILMSLLNAILHLENEDKISEIVYLNPLNPAIKPEGKKSIVDIKVRDEKGSWYEVEAQVYEHPGYIERTAYYIAKLYSNQAGKGQKFFELTPAIGISILNFRLFKESKKVQETFEFRNVDGSLILPNTMSLHYIDLINFNRKKPAELQTPFEKWLHLMKFSKAYARMKVDASTIFPVEEELNMALSEHLRLNADEAMRIRMEQEERARLDEIFLRNYSLKLGMEKGRAEGRVEGRVEGLAEGIAQVAMNLLQMGMPVESVSKATGLSIEQITQLVKDKS